MDRSIAAFGLCSFRRVERERERRKSNVFLPVQSVSRSPFSSGQQKEEGSSSFFGGSFLLHLLSR